MLSEDTPGPRDLFVDIEHGNRQAAFRRRLQESGLVWTEVSAPQQLELLLYQALQQLQAAERPRQRDFFISYTIADKEWAEWIAWQLEAAGYSVLLQSWDFAPGDNFVSETQLALESADKLIAVVSPSYIRSNSTLSEFESAFTLINSRQRLIPIRVAGGELPGTLSGVIHVDLFGVTADVARQRLLSAARATYRSKPMSEPSFPGSWRGLDSRPPKSPAFEGGKVQDPPVGASGHSNNRLRALIISSEEDERFAVGLSEALEPLRSEGLIATVGLRRVMLKDAIDETPMDPRLDESAIVLLVISRALLSLEYGSSRELRVLIERHKRQRTVLVPVLYKAVAWQNQPYGHLSALPSTGTFVTQWATLDQAVKDIVEGVRLIAEDLYGFSDRIVIYNGPPNQGKITRPSLEGPLERDLGEVFKPSGVPTLTFVEPDDFTEFRMALRQPGLGVVLEGPSGIGKTTLLRHAVEQDSEHLDPVRILSARRRAELQEIAELSNGHSGVVAVDDFHRLPAQIKDDLADYLKRLADEDDAAAKLIVVGIPGIANDLVSVGNDLATRIRVFRLGSAPQGLIRQMVEKGEAALKIAFEGKAEIIRASAGSLLTAQMLCWHLATMAGVERTLHEVTRVHTDISIARTKVYNSLKLKYERMVGAFIAMDGSDQTLCIDLLLFLASTVDGILSLEAVRKDQPLLRPAIDQVFIESLPTGFERTHSDIGEHLYYDARGRRLIADDPQLIFYVRQLSRDDLLGEAGKRLPVERDQVFVCYSHRDATYLDRLQVHLRPLERAGLMDLWSDRRLEPGDDWRREIELALSRARAAILLVSADFLASDFIQEVELPHFLSSAEEGGCWILPILVRPSMFDDTPSLARFQHVNPGGVTLSEMEPNEGERVLVQIARSLIKSLDGKLYARESEPTSTSTD